jgi:hypothetical protein
MAERKRTKGHTCIMPLSVYRCGADMMVHDNSGKTAEDIILTEKPDGWQEMLHWWNKFKPGKYPLYFCLDKGIIHVLYL